LQTLYYNGAENFWVHGTGPLGCLPQKLAVPRANDSDIDSSGCLKPLNDGSYEFNNQLGSQLRGATIVYVDILADKILSGEFSKPKLSFDYFCNKAC
jgi:hypothetical protein